MRVSFRGPRRRLQRLAPTAVLVVGAALLNLGLGAVALAAPGQPASSQSTVVAANDHPGDGDPGSDGRGRKGGGHAGGGQPEPSPRPTATPTPAPARPAPGRPAPSAATAGHAPAAPAATAPRQGVSVAAGRIGFEAPSPGRRAKQRPDLRRRSARRFDHGQPRCGRRRTAAGDSIVRRALLAGSGLISRGSVIGLWLLFNLAITLWIRHRRAARRPRPLRPITLATWEYRS